MFYPAVEEYVMQNRQRELAKNLKLRRQFRDALESKSGHESYFLAKVSDRLRNLVRFSKADTSASFDDETTLDCVAC